MTGELPSTVSDQSGHGGRRLGPATTVAAAEPRPDRLPLRLILVLGCLASFAPLSIDLYLPALPRVADSFHTSASSVQLTLTACLVGIGLGQLVAGPLSDRLGRRRPLIVGVSMFAVFSLLCAVAPTLPLLLLARLFQALGGSAGIVISRAIARDLRSGEALARLFSILMVVNGMAPILAPIIGAQLLRFSSWRGDFVVLALLGGALVLATATVVRESLPPASRQAAGVAAAVVAYRTLLRHGSFMAMVGSGALAFAAMFTYISGSPFVLEQHFGLSAQTFSFVFGVNAVAIIVGVRVRIHSSLTTMRTGLVVMAVGAAAAVCALASGIGLALLLPGFLLVTFGYGMVAPNSLALALADHPRTAGAAAAVYGATQYLAGGALAPLGGLGGRPITVAVVIAGCAAGGLVLGSVASRRPRSAEAASEPDRRTPGAERRR